MIINLFLYIISFFISLDLVYLLHIPSTTLDFLSISANIAAFGTALITLANILERDKFEGIKNDIKILYEDILKAEVPKHWNFMRKSDKNTFGPTITFESEKSSFTVRLPITLEDVFKLPVFSDYRKILANRRRYTSNKESVDYYKFLCVADILRKSVILRISRYFKHFSSGLILGSVLSLLRFFLKISFPI